MKHCRPKLAAVVLIMAVGAASGRADNQIITYQQGVNGYAGQQDTVLAIGFPDRVRGSVGTSALYTDYPILTSDPAQMGMQVLLRFDGIALNVPVISATLLLTTSDSSSDPGDGAIFYRMLQPWTAADTHNKWVNGIQSNGSEASSTPSFQVGGPGQSIGPGQTLIDVTADVQAWSAGQANYGWATQPLVNGSDGWGFRPGIYQFPAPRPLLTITYGFSSVTRTWADQSNDHQWNALSTNWKVASQNGSFATGDVAIFNDAPGAGHYQVTMPNVVQTTRMLVNASGNYHFSGAGAVGGVLGASLTKLGSGTLTLANAASHDFTGGVSLFQGTLALDLNAVAGHTDQIGPRASLMMRNATLTILGSNNATSSQTFSYLTFDGGGSSRITINDQGGPGVKLSFQALIRNHGATVDFSVIPAGSVINASGEGISGYATYNKTDWVNMPGNGTQPGAISPLSVYLNDDWLNASSNTNVTISKTFGANATTNTLRFNTPVSTTLTLSSASVTATLFSGGILNTANVGPNNNLITGGRITAGNFKDVIIHQYNTQGTLTLASQIVNLSTGNLGLTITGPGTVVVSNANNNFPGVVTVNGSILSIPAIALSNIPSTLGSSSQAASNLVLNQGTLRYTGPQGITDRLFTLGPDGGTIEAAGTGALIFAGPGSIAFSQIVPTQLTLAGSYTGNNQLFITLIDPDSVSHQYALSLLKTGASKWQITGSNTFTGGITIQQGTLEIGNNNANGTPGTGPILNNATFSLNRNNAFSLSNALSGTGTLVKASSGTATLAGPYSATGPIAINAGKLVFGPNTAGIPSIQLKTTSLTLAANTTLDLTNNPLLLQSDPLIASDKSNKLASMRTLLATGFNAGDWLGKGITSSTVAQDQSATGSHLTALALYDNALLNLPTLSGMTANTSSIFITTALIGDTNFDNLVNDLDFTAVTTHWQTSQSNWSAGDLNYDGFVDLLDAVIVARNIGHQLNDSSLVLAPAAVPEPASAALLLPAVLLLRGRRSKRYP